MQVQSHKKKTAVMSRIKNWLLSAECTVKVVGPLVLEDESKKVPEFNQDQISSTFEKPSACMNSNCLEPSQRV